MTEPMTELEALEARREADWAKCPPEAREVTEQLMADRDARTSSIRDLASLMREAAEAGFVLAIDGERVTALWLTEGYESEDILSVDASAFFGRYGADDD